jgi:DNA polymerase-1
LRLLGWKVIAVPGVRADDVIGTLACVASRPASVNHLQRRQDLSQLVDEHILRH